MKKTHALGFPIPCFLSTFLSLALVLSEGLALAQAPSNDRLESEAFGAIKPDPPPPPFGP